MFDLSKIKENPDNPFPGDHDVLALAQNGDFIGGAAGGIADSYKIKRKAMNSLICSIHRRVTFLGRINEDVNSYTLLGSRGKLFMTVNQIALHQLTTQANTGGMTDIYLDNGTYVKSFYSVIAMPSSVKISMMGDKRPRLHHRVKWKNTVPRILSENVKISSTQ